MKTLERELSGLFKLFGYLAICVFVGVWLLVIAAVVKGALWILGTL